MSHLAEDIDSVALETRAESARVESGFETLDPDATKTAFNDLDAILSDLAKQVIHTLDQMIPYLARMQALLSQRGSARKKILKQAGLPSWPEYATLYAQKLSCSVRTIQDHIMVFRSTGKSGPSRQKRTRKQSKPRRLDARQQATLVKAQLAANDIVAALKSGGDWQSAVAKYDKVAVAPARLDSYVNTLNQEPDWKQVLVELMDVLEKYGEKLPQAVLKQKRVIETMLSDRKDLTLRARDTNGKPANRYHKRSKLDEEGQRSCTVKTEGEKNAWGTLEVESEADEAIASLNSPVVSLMDLDSASKMLPASVTPIDAGSLDLDERVA